MDLRSMLISEPKTIDPEVLEEKTTLLQLSGTIQGYLNDSLRYPTLNNNSSNTRSSTYQSPLHQNNGYAGSQNQSLPPPTCPTLGPEVEQNPASWSPRLSLEVVNKEQSVNIKPYSLLQRKPQEIQRQNSNEFVQLVTHKAVYREGEPRIFLEETYDIQGAYPRGLYVLMAKRNMPFNFLFEYPDHPWFEDLYGLRKSAYIVCRTREGELWEMHLKPSRDKQWLFGYLIKHEDVIRIVRESLDELLAQRKLPLVLDLDDTLVRLIGEGSDRFVSENDLHKYENRVAVLRDGRRVVLTHRVHEFLEWAQTYYDISVCSLGDQNYVDNVVQVLDPQRTRIRGILYSARSEHDFIKRSPDSSRPPKDLLALYSFCALKDKSLGSTFSLPLIIDDETRMWPTDQCDNIIEVKQQANTDVWSVNLFPAVQETLNHIHHEFFRQLDTWYGRHWEAEQNGTICNRYPPSAVGIYKTYLRHILRDRIISQQ